MLAVMNNDLCYEFMKWWSFIVKCLTAYMSSFDVSIKLMNSTGFSEIGKM